MKMLFCCAVAVMAFCTNMCYAGETYVAEGYIVVDAKAVDIYIRENQGADSYESKRAQAAARVLEDINYILNETNKLFGSLNTYGLDIQLRARALNILNTSLFPEGALQNGNVIVDSIAHKLFSDWLKQQEAYFRLNFDFSLLWTGYDLYGASGISTTAIANIGKVCDPVYATSVVEFRATYDTVVTTAHTVALLFGATYDGIASDQIMAITNSPLHKRRWSFSECSANDIKDFFRLVRPTCLLSTNPNSTKPQSSYLTYQGRLFNHNAICERSINDTRSYACLSSNLYGNLSAKGDQICQQIYCLLPGTVLCQPTYTSDGLICDYRKRCDKGKCVADTSAASTNVDSECVLGDQKVLDLPRFPFNGTCQQFVDQEGRDVCYNSVIKDICCTTCKKYRSAVAGCEYGDKNDLCPTLPTSTSCSPQNRAICCYTCRFPFNGTCQQFVDQEGRDVCYNSVIKDICCTTCKKYRSAVAGCEYGDKNDLCPTLPTSTSCSPQNRAICCYTCRGAIRKRSTPEDLFGYRIEDDSHKEAHRFEGFKPKFDDSAKVRAA